MSTSLTIYSLVSPQWYIHIWTSPQEHLCVVSVEGGCECQCHTLNRSLGHWVIPSQTGSGPKQNYRQTGQHSFSHVFLPQCYKSLKWFHADCSSESTCEKGEEWSVQHQNSSRVSAERLTNTWTLGTFFYPEWVSEVNNVRPMFESSLIIRVSYLVSFLLSFCLKVMIKMCFCCWEKTINELY